MDDANNLLIKLQDLSQFFAGGNLDDDLTRQAELAARLVGADTCSVMLINGGEGDNLRMSVRAKYGPLPPAAWTGTTGLGEGIAGHVLASGQSLLVEDIRASRFAHLARRADDPRRSLMLAPVGIDGKIVGIVNACASTAKGTFTRTDLHLLEVIALFIGKSIQVLQLQTILNSRFTQLALLRHVEEQVGGAMAGAYRHPDQVARILAKSLFKEMKQAGFDSAHIIGAASEIIAQLNANLARHSERAARQDESGKAH
ncbi:MAG: GAF domain-containing protein [Pseudomonadota bacterium]